MTEKNIENTLLRDGVYVSTTSGVSMYPMLRDRRDTIVVTQCASRLKKYDVALFKRGEQYVLHRVIKVLPDSYFIRGDNCIAYDVVKDADVLGKLTEFYRSDKKKSVMSPGYRFYSGFIVLFHPFVSLKLKIKGRLQRRRR